MQILALDPATRMGYAHSCGLVGTWDFRTKRDESVGLRLIKLEANLNKMYSNQGISLLVYESARNASSFGAGALVVQSEIQGVIKLFCEKSSIQYQGYSPSEIKKHATGSGSASKVEMISAALRKWPEYGMLDDNAADALWLLDLARSRYL